MLDLLIDPNAWIALAALTALEIVLGIDNVVFISILVARLPVDQARVARQIGLSAALIFRIAFLFCLTWLIGLTKPLATLWGNGVSGRDVILIGGGLFLIAKATREIHHDIDPDRGAQPSKSASQPAVMLPSHHPTLLWTIAQVIAVDLVFSLDSIITAIGTVQDVRIMIAAVMIAVALMYVASAPLASFIAKHPTTKMLALTFVILIGVALVADGFDFHIPRGYVYFAMAFASLVETFNIFARRNRST